MKKHRHARAFQMTWEEKLFTRTFVRKPYCAIVAIKENNISWRLSLSWRNFTSFRWGIHSRDSREDATTNYKNVQRGTVTASFCDDIQRRQTFLITVGDLNGLRGRSRTWNNLETQVEEELALHYSLSGLSLSLFLSGSDFHRIKHGN